MGDDDHGGSLGDSATYDTCAKREWAAWCGTTAEYMIEAVVKNGFCKVKIQGDTTGRCQMLPKNAWFKDDDHGGSLGASATHDSCAKRDWANWCGTTAEYTLEAAPKSMFVVRALGSNRYAVSTFKKA